MVGYEELIRQANSIGEKSPELETLFIELGVSPNDLALFVDEMAGSFYGDPQNIVDILRGKTNTYRHAFITGFTIAALLTKDGLI